MKILFVHQNFPGQYLHVARHLGRNPDHRIVFLTQRRDDASLPGVQKIVYKPQREVTRHLHHYLRDTEAGVLNAQAVARVALDLKRAGFVPDLMVGHNGWGEIWYLKDVFPQAPLLGYFEFFRRPWGGILDFDPEYPPTFDSRAQFRTLASLDLVGLNTADWGQTAMQWQRAQHPARYHDMISVVHEGINTDTVRPDPAATLAVDGVTLGRGDEVITFVSRNLEPYRGFHIFMRALPAILKRRPKAHVVIIGGRDGVRVVERS